MTDKKIAVITYDYPHRKTQDVVFQLKAKGYQKVKLLALPFVKRERKNPPLYAHRPSEAIPVYPEELAENFGYECLKVTTEELEKEIESYNPYATLIAGAGLLPKSLVENQNIINSHPAYLPLVRGLDALKWAIILQEKIGVTTHFVDAKADAGNCIDRKEVPVYSNDTFHSVAYRQYRMEIEMLIDALSFDISDKSRFEPLPDTGEVHKRIPPHIEENLLSAFEKYKKDQVG